MIDPQGATTTNDIFAMKIGRALINGHDELSEAISFKAGCAVIAPMFAEVLECSSLVMSVITQQPEISVHAIWETGRDVRLIDSRERGYARNVPEVVSRPPTWDTGYPGTMRVELRTNDHVPECLRGLEVIASLLLPFLELSRRTDRLNRATSLLEVALNAIATRDSDAVYREIIRRIGEGVQAPAAYYPATDGVLPRDLQSLHIYPGGLSNRVSEHLFTSLAQFDDGPVQRAFASPLQAAPTTRDSMASGETSERTNALLSRLNVVDYMAIRVVHGETPIGVIVSVLTTADAEVGRVKFTQPDIATVASSAFMAGWAIPMAQQQRTLRRSLQESEMLRHLAQVSAQHRDQEETLSMASGVARVLFGADYVAIGSVNEDGFPSNYRYVSGNRTDVHQSEQQPVVSSRFRAWLANPITTVIDDFANEPGIAEGELQVHRQEGLVTSITVPFQALDGTWLYLIIGFREHQTLSDDDVRFANALAQTIASTM